LHLRDGEALRHVLPFTARVFGRAVVMPNLRPPVSTLAQAEAYRARILAALPRGAAFQPLMTLYLTDVTQPSEVAAAAASGLVAACKLYPAGATTNSADGVTDVRRLAPVLEAMAEAGLPLLLHGETTRGEVDVYDREAVFLEETLGPLLERHPRLRCVLEHITTAEAVAFVRAAPAGRLGATVTPQHVTHCRNDMLVGGLRPHLYCLPVLKRERHRAAVCEAATSGEARFFLGTDSAPHARGAKEAACGCAGCFSAPTALPLYAAAFEKAGALHNLEAFASLNGPAFYGRRPSEARVRLTRRRWRVPESYAFGEETVVPLGAGTELEWAVEEAT